MITNIVLSVCWFVHPSLFYDNFVYFQSLLAKIDVNRCLNGWYLTQTDTNRLKIDINHNKNHWRTVLWLSTRQKLTILRIFDYFPRQIEVDWCQYVCYLNKYSSDTLTGCRNWYKSLWKPLKSVIVAIYTTKTVNFAHFRSFLTSNWHQLTSICVLSQ